MNDDTFDGLYHRSKAVNTLKFSNKTFHSGLNITVRRGTKWYGTKNVWIELGEGMVVFCDKIHTQIKKFSELSNLDLEHDPKCRTYSGLLDVMCEVYPDFNPDEEVTLVYFFMPETHKPEINEPIVFVEMVSDELGQITNIIDLDNGFYEVEISLHDGRFGSMLINHFHYSFGYGGWFKNNTFTYGRNNG